MAVHVIRRLIQAIPVMLFASIFVFSILQLVPGDPATNLAGTDASEPVARGRLISTMQAYRQVFDVLDGLIEGSSQTTRTGGA